MRVEIFIDILMNQKVPLPQQVSPIFHLTIIRKKKRKTPKMPNFKQFLFCELLERVKRLPFSSSLCTLKYRKMKKRTNKEAYVAKDLLLYLLSRLKSKHSQNFILSTQKVAT